MAARLIWRGNEIEEKVTAAAKAAVDETTRATAEQAQQRVPVLTGQLRNSIRAEPASTGPLITGRVVAGMPYALFVELGTSRSPAQPYLRPSADAENTKLSGRIKGKIW